MVVVLWNSILQIYQKYLPLIPMLTIFKVRYGKSKCSAEITCRVLACLRPQCYRGVFVSFSVFDELRPYEWWGGEWALLGGYESTVWFFWWD